MKYLLVLAICSIVLANDTERVDYITKSYESQKQRLDVDYEKKVRALKKLYADRYRAAKLRAVKSGDLNLALYYEKKVGEMESGAAQPQAANPSNPLIAKWQCGKTVWQFMTDGRVISNSLKYDKGVRWKDWDAQKKTFTIISGGGTSYPGWKLIKNGKKIEDGSKRIWERL